MPVRKTETRIPLGSAASDLGEASVATDGRCALVSFITSPWVVNRENTYVVFVTNAGLAAAAQSFEWSFSENGETASMETTPVAEAFYSPQGTGSPSVTVRILDAANAEQANLSLTQSIVPLHDGLEALIATATDQPVQAFPIRTSRGNWLRITTPTIKSSHSPFRRRVTRSGSSYSICGFEDASKCSPEERRQLIEELAQALDSTAIDDFVNRTGEGVSVCNIRLPLLTSNRSAGAPWARVNP
jgi:hypothetical protein